MLRTPIRTKFSKHLIRINDQLCFAALGRREFGERIDQLAKDSPGELTTTVFTSNPYASRISRRLGDMPEFAARSEQIELQMGVIAGCEHAIAYLEEIEQFRKTVCPGSSNDMKGDAIEDQLYAKMTEWLGRAPERAHYRTLGYLRLLRNHYAHVNEEKTPSFSKYIATRAHHLQRFWARGITDIGPLQFRSLPDGPLSAESSFAIMNLLRICIDEIDQDFASTLNLSEILGRTVVEVYERAKSYDRDPIRFSRRVRAAILNAYGEKADIDVIRTATDAFLAASKKQK